MAPDEFRLYEAAASQGLSITRRPDGDWDVAAAPDELVGIVTEPFETLLAGDLIRLPDGRVLKRIVTDAELKELLAID
jgi:hypothetical protein